MRAYADSSFILRLVTAEADSEEVIAEYRRIGKPPLFFLPLHALEVRNAILQRAFHQRRSITSPTAGIYHANGMLPLPGLNTLSPAARCWMWRWTWTPP